MEGHVRYSRALVEEDGFVWTMRFREDLETKGKQELALNVCNFKFRVSHDHRMYSYRCPDC